VVDVVAELLHHLEREREAGRRSADIAGIDLHSERQLDDGRLVGREADDGTACVERVGDRAHGHLQALAAAP